MVKASITGSIIGNLLLVLGLSFFAGGFKIPSRDLIGPPRVRRSLRCSWRPLRSLFRRFSTWSPPSRTLGHRPKNNAFAGHCAWFCFSLTRANACSFSLKTHKNLFVWCKSGRRRRISQSSRGMKARDTAKVGRKKQIYRRFVSRDDFRGAHYRISGRFGRSGARNVGLDRSFRRRDCGGNYRQRRGTFVGGFDGDAQQNGFEPRHRIGFELANRLVRGAGFGVSPLMLFGKPMDLEFTIPEIVGGVLAICRHRRTNCGDGESNWLEGAQLLSVYLVLGILFYLSARSASRVEGANSRCPKPRISCHEFQDSTARIL